MSLLRLLTAGKSLVGLKESDGRYCVTRQRLLPEFGTKRNPFRTPKEVPPELDAASPSPGAAGPSTSPGVSPSRALDIAAPVDGRTPGHGRLANWVSKCARKVASVGSKGGPKAAKPAIPAFAKPMVQTEMSLDRVKVVRNDLSDSDLEIVRMRPQPPPFKQAPVVQTEEKPHSAERPWNRMAGRLFGVGKT